MFIMRFWKWLEKTIKEFGGITTYLLRYIVSDLPVFWIIKKQWTKRYSQLPSCTLIKNEDSLHYRFNFPALQA